MAHLGVELHDIETFFAVISLDGEEQVDLDQFVHGCLAMKGPATAIDIQQTLVETRKVRNSISATNSQMLQMQKQLEGLTLQYHQLLSGNGKLEWAKLGTTGIGGAIAEA